jgi:hypothetical protein
MEEWWPGSPRKSLWWILDWKHTEPAHSRSLSCYITVDFATAASQNSVCITQQMFSYNDVVHDCSMIKDECNNKKSEVFQSFFE